MSLAAVSLDDKYTLDSGRVFLSGTQALVRLPMMQRQRDLAAGINTAGFISGYRGSPLGGYDLNLWRAKQFLERSHIHFEPGINEELAATAVWGTQQVNMFKDAKYDGVFSIWYGKGPGLDRAGDAIKHGNSAGTSPHGGVLLIAGDDHGASSSTLAHQSDHNLVACMVPVLNPAGVQDYLDFGLIGWAMSRYAGIWVGFTAVADTVESSASVCIDPHRLEIVTPEDFEMPPGGLNIRWPDDPLSQEARLHDFKRYAARAFARANHLDKIVIDSPKPRLGIVTTGKAYLDVRQALESLGIGDAEAAEAGLRVLKVGMSWPLDSEGLLRFADGLEEIIVVEEKRPLLEDQVKAQLYEVSEKRRPRVIGKFDEENRRVLCTAGVLSPGEVARFIASRLTRYYKKPHVRERIAYLDAKEQALAAQKPAPSRQPYFCSGCPHNTSTKVPEGSRALAGIGCHFMAVWMNRETATYTQMGGEGATWIGQAPFTETKHVFQNLGDGTYTHSGSLAIRAAIAAGVNITYKILYNDAVAMTGGQPVEGQPSVNAMAWQVRAEGVGRVAVVSDDPKQYAGGATFPPGTTIHHRDELDALQRELREVAGVSVLIYDQTCAAEKRRRRKRGLYPDPPKRVFINELVCEGCGDCSVASNCLSVVPVETEFGRKRAIDQSSCNKDFSCLNGFCPSFVTVHGGAIRRRHVSPPDVGEALESIPLPQVPGVDTPYGMLVAGVGGTGVVTIGALLGMAHIEGKGCTVHDQTGLAQKGGAVISHVRVAAKPEDLNATRIDTGAADLLMAADMVVGASALSKIEKGRGRIVANSHAIPTAASTLNPDANQHTDLLRSRLGEAAGADRTDFVDATGVTTSVFGDSIGTNLFLVGYAFQKGAIPISLEAIEKAVELNGVAVETNLRIIRWGRLAAHNPDLVTKLLADSRGAATGPTADETLDQRIARRAEFLTGYQNAAYARRYQNLVALAMEAEMKKAKGRTGFADAVARYAFKLMAYKDEYEVARLYTDPAFHSRLNEQFEGDFKLQFHLAPPLLARRDPATGQIKKRDFGPWMMRAFKILARLRGLRGGRFDVFGYQAERRAERQLIADYEALVRDLSAKLDTDNHGVAIELAGGAGAHPRLWPR